MVGQHTGGPASGGGSAADGGSASDGGPGPDGRPASDGGPAPDGRPASDGGAAAAGAPRGAETAPGDHAAAGRSAHGSADGPFGAIVAGPPASVTFRRPLVVDAAQAWDAVTAPARLGVWLGPVHGDLAQGGTYEVRMGADEPGSDQNATGVVRSCDPGRGYAVTWGFPGEASGDLAVRVEPAGDRCVLVLAHTGLTAEQAVGYGAGWHTSLDRLDDHLARRPVRDWDERFGQLLPRYRESARR